MDWRVDYSQFLTSSSKLKVNKLFQASLAIVVLEILSKRYGKENDKIFEYS